jgi:hypothetical protein
VELGEDVGASLDSDTDTDTVDSSAAEETDTAVDTDTSLPVDPSEDLTRGRVAEEISLWMNLNPPPCTRQIFDDLPIDHPQCPEMMAGINKGAMTPLTSEHSGVDEMSNRAETSYILWRYLNEARLGSLGAINPQTAPFPDVELSSWYAPYVATLQNERAYSELPTDLFRPSDPVEQSELSEWTTNLGNNGWTW